MEGVVDRNVESTVGVDEIHLFQELWTMSITIYQNELVLVSESLKDRGEHAPLLLWVTNR